jgi:hypothetical protein
MKLRIGESGDEAFLVEMARLACGPEDHPLPQVGDPEVERLSAPAGMSGPHT